MQDGNAEDGPLHCRHDCLYGTSRQSPRLRARHTSASILLSLWFFTPLHPLPFRGFRPVEDLRYAGTTHPIAKYCIFKWRAESPAITSYLIARVKRRSD